MRINKIILNNVCQSGHRVIEPKTVNIIEGANGAGKSSIIKAIRAGLTVAPRGGDFVGLLADGESSGTIALTLDRDVKITRDLSPVGSPLVIESKALGRLKDAAANKYVSGTFDASSVNCEQFLTKDKAEQLKVILQSMPFRLDVEAFQNVVGDFEALDEHPLLIVDRVRKGFYDKRAEVNKSAKDKRAAADELAGTIVGIAGIRTLDEEIETNESLLVGLEKERQEKIEHIKIKSDAFVKEKREEMDAAVDARRRETISAVEALRAQIQVAESERTIFENKEVAKFHAFEVSAFERVNKVSSEADAHYEDNSSGLRTQLANYRASRDTEVAAEAQRAIVQRQVKEAALLDLESSDLTKTLDAIDTFKGSMLKALPIPGVEIREGEVFINNEPFSHIPDSQKVIFNIKLHIIRSGEGGIILADKVDDLDERNFEEVVKFLSTCGRQSFITRATVGTESDPIEGVRIRTVE